MPGFPVDGHIYKYIHERGEGGARSSVSITLMLCDMPTFQMPAYTADLSQNIALPKNTLMICLSGSSLEAIKWEESAAVRTSRFSRATPFNTPSEAITLPTHILHGHKITPLTSSW